jgi:AraC-like DNA-binding protein/mannose-6-phosphate isomerase-like protein (cupin superfamily)
VKQIYYKASRSLQNIAITIPDPGLKTNVYSVCVFPFNPGERLAEHAHSFIETHYIIEGYGAVVVNGVAHALRPGDFYITGPGVKHAQNAAAARPMLEYGFKCSLQVLGSAATMNNPLAAEYRFLSAALNSRFCVVRDSHDVRSAFERIFTEAYHARPGYLTSIRQGVWDLIVRSARNVSGTRRAPYQAPVRDQNAYRLEMATDYLADNMHRKVLSSELARHLAMSEKQLGRLVRGRTGMPLHAFILRKKVDRAVQLISGTDNKLSTIAQATGFSSEFHLSRTVKKYTNLPPSKLRR